MMSRTRQMDGAIGVQKRGSGFLNESAPRLGQFGRSFPIAVKQLESVLRFKFGNLPTEGRLRNSQPMRSAA